MRNSVSHKENTGVSYSIKNNREFNDNTVRLGNIIFIHFNCQVLGGFASWEDWVVGTGPIPIGGTQAQGVAFQQVGDANPTVMAAHVDKEGNIHIQNKSGLSVSKGWMFVSIVYVCAA